MTQIPVFGKFSQVVLCILILHIEREIHFIQFIIDSLIILWVYFIKYFGQ